MIAYDDSAKPFRSSYYVHICYVSCSAPICFINLIVFTPRQGSFLAVRVMLALQLLEFHLTFSIISSGFHMRFM